MKRIIIITLALSLILVTGCNPEQFNKLDKYKVNLDVDLNQKIELNGIYPIGSIYISTDFNSPAKLFGLDYTAYMWYNVKYK